LPAAATGALVDALDEVVLVVTLVGFIVGAGCVAVLEGTAVAVVVGLAVDVADGIFVGVAEGTVVGVAEGAAVAVWDGTAVKVDAGYGVGVVACTQPLTVKSKLVINRLLARNRNCFSIPCLDA